MNRWLESTEWASDPRFVYGIGLVAVLFAAATIWLLRRKERRGRIVGGFFLLISIALHALLIWAVPMQSAPNTSNKSSNHRSAETSAGAEQEISFSTFDPELTVDDAANQQDHPLQDEPDMVAPLPVSPLAMRELETPLEIRPEPEPVPDTETPIEPSAAADPLPTPTALTAQALPPETTPEETTLTESTDGQIAESADPLQAALLELLSQRATEAPPTATPPKDSATNKIAKNNSPAPQTTATADPSATSSQQADSDASTTAASAVIPGQTPGPFASRKGAARQQALKQTGGDARTENAVKSALRFLADSQLPNGSWDPTASGAGIERRPLGEVRTGAGTKCSTAITGLSLLALMGAGNTHLDGPYAKNVYNGLAYLIKTQAPNGSLAGNATIYASTYCHGMAALAMCEAAAMTRDPSAIESARRAVMHTLRTQHPTTGGWRYVPGDPGDLSQLGWQAMVLRSGQRAGINIPEKHFLLVQRFIRSVRAGRGGLASYRTGERASPTMTAEALATRLLMGQSVPANEIQEAEAYLLQNPPGRSHDNYYYWYYATIALHQVQGEAWQQWNETLKRRLVATQRTDGSWPNSTVWGGYGGTIYTTAMATLCLESYYRYDLRSEVAQRVAELDMIQRR